MKIKDLLCVPGLTGFYVDDQAAILAGAEHDGFDYVGEPITPGFTSIREAGQSLSVLLVLDNGEIAQGDCAVVQYSGAGGREPLFNSLEAQALINQHVLPILKGRTIVDFRSMAQEIDHLEIDGKRISAAIRYGLTQALLDAVAKNRSITMAEVIQDEYQTGIDIAIVPMHTQSGDERYSNVDKMILKEAGVLPHGLINNMETKLGKNGEIFKEYVGWVRDRILSIRKHSDYSPVLQFDAYGTIGQAFDSDVQKCADYLVEVSKIAAPFQLRVEHVIDGKSVDGQVKVSKALREALKARGSDVQLSVDEWCNTLEDIRLFVEAEAADVIHVKMPDLGGVNNTIEALLLIHKSGLGGYCGGTCNETDRSAQISAHIAMACGAIQILAKPGMGVDEGMMIVGNEMARTAALVAYRK
ncbi:MAG TPA: methylaspartate ammonia-lyase [Candidatus Paceibacterota bacterium]|nr:methylaspartate ammonia-lyase [Candidatus Paceibacterota bacterium]